METHSAFIWLVCLLPFLGLGVGMAGNKLVDVADQQAKKSRLNDLQYKIRKKELEQQLQEVETVAAPVDAQQKSVGIIDGLDACKRRYEAAVAAHSKAQTSDEENRLFDEVIAATDAYRAAKASNG
jgi:hypothetical protein